MNDSKLQKLIGIVNKMNTQGIPLNEIRNNLKQTGLTDDKIDVILAKANINPTQEEIHQAVVSIDKKISSGEYIKDLEKELGRNTKDTIKIKKNVDDLQTELRIHRKKLDKIHKDLVGEKGPIKAYPELEDKISELTDLINNLKPVLKSIDSSTKKIIELNRKVLMKL